MSQDVCQQVKHTRLDQVLGVVQDQQQFFLAQEVQQLRFRRLGARGNETHCVCHGPGDSFCGVHTGQLHQPHTVEKHGRALRGRFQCQPRLARAARAKNGHQTRVGRCQEAPQVGQFSLAADKTGGGGRQVVARPAHRGADALEEGGRLAGWFGIELAAQDVTARLILRHGSAELAAARQGQHALAVRLLTPRIHSQQAPRGIDGTAEVSAVQQKRRQCIPALQGQLTQPHPLDQHPVLELRCVAHVETLQKFSLVER